MADGVEIRGGAGEFEAAVIAIVLDHIARQQSEAAARARFTYSDLPAWVKAQPQLTPGQGLPAVEPEHR